MSKELRVQWWWSTGHRCKGYAKTHAFVEGKHKSVCEQWHNIGKGWKKGETARGPFPACTPCSQWVHQQDGRGALQAGHEPEHCWACRRAMAEAVQET